MAALLRPSTLPRETNALHIVIAKSRVDTLIGSQANYEIKITIYIYKIMISYQNVFNNELTLRQLLVNFQMLLLLIK